eukprot:4687451-Heterocapsa_arctica.AAC.1
MRTWPGRTRRRRPYGRAPNFGSRDFGWKGAMTRHRGDFERVAGQSDAKARRTPRPQGPGAPWGRRRRRRRCGFCCVFAMCSKSRMA